MFSAEFMRTVYKRLSINSGHNINIIFSFYVLRPRDSNQSIRRRMVRPNRDDCKVFTQNRTGSWDLHFFCAPI